MKQFWIFITLLIMLAGCSEQSGQTYTVDQLVADEALLSRVMTECRNNPGDRHQMASCRNAEAADGKLRLRRMRQSLGG
jgi:hypothetical protein